MGRSSTGETARANEHEKETLPHPPHEVEGEFLVRAIFH
jgi:hypothetical protein